jgi:hypothetical protein
MAPFTEKRLALNRQIPSACLGNPLAITAYVGLVLQPEVSGERGQGQGTLATLINL